MDSILYGRDRTVFFYFYISWSTWASLLCTNALERYSQTLHKCERMNEFSNSISSGVLGGFK